MGSTHHTSNMTKAFSAAIVILLTGPVLTASPKAELESRCPCERYNRCETIFGEDGEEAYLDILEAIPQCPRFQVRCCTKDTMFETLMRILNRNTDDVNDDLPDEDSLETARFFDAGTNDKVDESRDGKDVEEEDTFAEADQIFQFFVADEEAAVDSDEGTASASFTGKVSCIPADQCRMEDIFGTKEEHFDLFGFISPTDTECLASEGKVLCVVPSQPLPVPNLTVPSLPVPSLPVPSLPVSLPVPNLLVPNLPVPNLTVPSLTVPNLPVPSLPVPNHPNPILSVPSLPNPSLPVPTLPLFPDFPAVNDQSPHVHTASHVSLPCTPMDQCAVIFGTKPEHSFINPQETCSGDFVRCVEQQVIAPTQPTSEALTLPTVVALPSLPEVPVLPEISVLSESLPCTQLEQCEEIYGTRDEHYVLYPNPSACPGDQVLCVQKVTTPTTVTPVVPTHPPAAAGSVQIIGPQPIYLSYNTIKGPTVGAVGGHEEPGSVLSSSGVDGPQSAAIDTLLRSLRGRLQQIIHG